MSHRPIFDKRIARLRKLTQRTPLPIGFDLVQWLKDRRYAQTTGEANRIILADRIRSGSHVIGTELIDGIGPDGQPEKQKVVARYQPARYKSDLIVLP